jgi:hypothetical protein
MSNQIPNTQYTPHPDTPPHVVYVERKKKHRFRNFVVLPAIALIGIIIIATAASGGNSSTGTSTPTGGTTQAGAKPTKTAETAPEDRGQPRPVTVGKAFTIGKHRFDEGWKLTYQEYLGSKVTGQVTNVSDDTSTAFFHIKFLLGSKVVANMQCSSGDLEPGQSENVECYNMVDGSSDKRIKYDKVTAEATF